MRYGSACSGMEAAHLAWAPLGWTTAWVAELDPAPCALLAYRLPEVPNLGDMTTIPERVRAGVVEATEVFIAGTPCQSFSVAGARRSLADSRGNLALTYCEIVNAIDDVRRARSEQECIAVWENVPGVLSTGDNAFGCFLGELAGEECALIPPGDRWPDAGVVVGPRRTLAWRVLDAQYFGLAQRRRRVFVVASARDGFDPFQVLFEPQGVQRDSAPRREAGAGSAVGALVGTSPGGGWRIGPDEAAAGHLIKAFGGNNTSGPIDVATARNACASASGRMDFESETFLVQEVAHTLRADGFDASEDGTGRGTPLVPVAFAHQGGGVQTTLGYDPHLGTTPTLSVGQTPAVHAGAQVRRLTPIECERLQGAPDNHTLIPNAKGKPMADGPRYKMLGNSFAVPVIRWIGQKIQAAEAFAQQLKEVA
ncbi:DNA cytosine methyltransferase [Pseudoxanthomonas sp. JBR18]|uniref:DNA cytosine methyltransferase n=1 Tax=Pseudoxanthomonas sp. JBR18 TaxID=2969308 RepID=UPI00230594D2|nr:DNA cytosine methyltransferase [Pseudoxanthomonas sp. JBR18]WCE04453.1 DNA cytosine methyltransferase [Pseudoxanthomonas sp. JBR18]